MTNETLFVVDVNVVVSAALLPNSRSRQAFDLALARGVVIASEAIIEELTNVLRRTKFDRYLNEHDRLRFLASYIQAIRMLEVTVQITDCRDPKDNSFWNWRLLARPIVSSAEIATCLIFRPFVEYQFSRPVILLPLIRAIDREQLCFRRA